MVEESKTAGKIILWIVWAIAVFLVSEIISGLITAFIIKKSGVCPLVRAGKEKP